MLFLTRTNLPEVRFADAKATRVKQGRRGATMMEYLMVLSLIVVVCLIGISYLGGTNNANMSNSSNAISKSLKKGS